MTDTVTYSVGAVGTGVLTLNAYYGSGYSWGYYNVTVAIPPVYSVAVTPDGNSAPPRPPNSSGHREVFTIKNNGNTSQTYTITCAGTLNVTCTGKTASSVTLAAGASTTDTAVYSVGAIGTGTLTMTASNANASDVGSYTVPVFYLSATLLNRDARGVDGFDVTLSHETPAYQSLGSPKMVALVYNSSTVLPTPAIQADVINSAPYPTHYSAQVSLASNGVRLRLLNGSDSVFYVAGTADTSRLVAAIDTKANGLTTGWFDVNVSITGYYSGGGVQSITIPYRLLVDDETTSLFGAGWQLSGLQRLYTFAGSFSALVTNGDGSMSFFKRDCQTCNFISPPGDRTVLRAVGTMYKRVGADSSAVLFASDGRMTGIWSGTLNAQVLTLTWNGTQLTSVRDYIGKQFTLGYTGPASPVGKLQTITDPAGRITTVWTDSLGKVTKIVDPDQFFTAFTYDAALRMTGVTNRSGAVTSFTYDALSRLDSTKSPPITDYTGASVRPTTTARAPERQAWDPAVTGVSLATAKSHARVDTIVGRFVDAVGGVSQIRFDRFSAPIKIIDPLGQVTTIQRDTLGQPTVVAMPTGRTVTNTYSGYQLNSTFDNVTGQTVNYAYNNVGMLITASGSTTRTDYYYYPSFANGPANGPMRAIYVGNTGTYTSRTDGFVADSFVYGAWGVDSLIIDGAGHRTKTFYSDTALFRNPIQVIDPFGRVVSQAHYDVAGRVDTVWTPANLAMVKRSFAYDVMNRVLTTTDPLGLTTQSVYGPVTLDRVIDAKGKVYRFDYNALGWLISQHDLADTTKADTLKYDAGGRIRTVRTKRGDAISLTYDVMGRVLTRSGPDFPVDSFRFDPAGRWVVGRNVNAYDSVAYDSAGRVVYNLVRFPGDSDYIMTYSYDSLGRPSARSAPRLGNPISYTYSRGAIANLCNAGMCTWWRERDADNLAHQITFGATTPHGWYRSLKTDSLHRIVSDSFMPRLNLNVAHLNPEFAKRWVYDTVGRQTAEVPYGSTYGFGGYNYMYDANGQLVKACHDNSQMVLDQNGNPIGAILSCIDEYGQDGAIPYRYDSTGNRTDPMANAVIAPGNRVTQFKGYTLVYDPNGAIVSKMGADTTLLTWDAGGTLTRVERWTPGSAHTIATYGYDAFGRRVSKTMNGVTEWYVHDGDNITLDVDGATHNLKAEYGWGSNGVDNLIYVRTSAWTAVAMGDRIGTIRGLVTAEFGTTLKQYPPGYWGEVSTDTGFNMRYRLAGREYDAESQLYYNRARYYDPKLGRFLSEDPTGLAGGINLYAYAGNDPVNFTDPAGSDTITLPPIIIEGDPDCQNYWSSIECYYEHEECISANNAWINGGCYDLPDYPRDEGDHPYGDAGGDDAATTAEALGLAHASCGSRWTDFGKSLALDAVGADLVKGGIKLAQASNLLRTARFNGRVARILQNSTAANAVARAGQRAVLADSYYGRAMTAQVLGAASTGTGALRVAREVSEPDEDSGFWKVLKAIPIIGTGVKLGLALDCSFGAIK
jgi:RHS repeat-associated protein